MPDQALPNFDTGYGMVSMIVYPVSVGADRSIALGTGVDITAFHHESNFRNDVEMVESSPTGSTQTNNLPRKNNNWRLTINELLENTVGVTRSKLRSVARQGAVLRAVWQEGNDIITFTGTVQSIESQNISGQNVGSVELVQFALTTDNPSITSAE